ncbi:MAG TPA: carboxypeptidase-like regulatory domain-containing protein [Burkholderiales bacterium]|nr:carboxypeptidase-like regulatory domain-containing protein [Burkholderiales bacterium]
MKANAKLAIGALALGLALPATAAVMMQNALPSPKTENGITYLDGGFGQDQAMAMYAEAKQYPLSMVFSADKNNEYLADVNVTIKDKAGNTVLTTLSSGPILMAKLPAGEYTITAEANGKTLFRTVKVQANGDTRLYLHWSQAT